MRRQLAVGIGLVAMLVAVLPVGVAAQDEEGPFPADTVAVGLDDGSATGVSVELSQVTFADGGADVVLIGRDDVFADSLASGVAQDEGPLLLVPTGGPVPQLVRDEIARLGAGRAVIFGGENAVSPAVADELAELGLAVERREGASRIETAVAVARADAAGATTAILARAGGVEGNPTSGFADALAAGGWSAATGWPVLLTQTEVLTGSTRTYLAEAGITDVMIMGGTAAVSEAVAGELQGMGISVDRVAGPDRAATAVETAKARGADTAADVDRVIVVDGFSDDAWVAGFGAGALSAETGAPIVLGNVEDLPPATQEWLVPGPETMVCAVTTQVCEQARLEVGFQPSLRVEVPPGSVVFTAAADDFAGAFAATFDGQLLGLAVECLELDCFQVDFTDDGDRLVILHRQKPMLVTTGLTLGTDVNFGVDLATHPSFEGDTYVSMDAMTESDGNDIAGLVRSDEWFSRIRISQAGQAGSGSCRCERMASFQAIAPWFADPTLEGYLQISNSGDLQLDVPGGDAAGFALVQRRPGSQMLGAAWDRAADGDIAIVDVVGGQGLLRIAPQGGDVVEVDGVDATSIPHWLATDAGVAVLADTDSGVSLVVADPATGQAEVVVDDAGDAAGGRVSGDASGTFIAWDTTTDIRVLDTRDGSVAVIDPPSGLSLGSGPVFRP